MFVNRPALGDFKENVKSLASGKSSHNSQKGLKSRSLNSFSDSTNVIQNKKNVSGVKVGDCNLLLKEKENFKPKVKMPDIKVQTPTEEDTWSDIEEMHICVEPDDDYEDILPKCERIQKQDINSLFFHYTSTMLTELTVDKLPSPLKDCPNLDVPEFSPLIPDIGALLFDDTNLDFVPLPYDLANSWITDE